MALIHRATVTPAKLELISGWLPGRPWATSAEIRQVGAYRFDDPAGAVGIEALLVRAGDGPVLHVPVTYRAEPLAGAEAHLIGITEHSVLGRRWVYDGAGDPVWARAVVTAVLTGGTEVEELVVQDDGTTVRRDPGARVSGSGVTGGGADLTVVDRIEAISDRDEGPVTLVRAAELEIVLVRVAGAEVVAPHTLTGHWAGDGTAVLAGVRPAT